MPEKALLPLARQNAYRERYRRLRPDWRSSGELLEALVRLNVNPASHVLDLGCGRGGVMELLWREVGLAVGADPDPRSLAEHRGAGMPLVRATGEALPFAGESIDVAVCLWVLEHLERPGAVLREVRRVLRPGGHFLFLTPNLLHPLLLANRAGQAAPGIQGWLVPRLYGRAADDTFSVRYRANTVRRLRTLAAESGLEVAHLRAVSDPTYLALNSFTFRASVLGERLLPAVCGVHLLGDFVRR